MALETGTFISDLVATNPTGSDPLAFADDHLRLVKSTIKNTFPNVSGAVTKTHTEINDALEKSGGTMTGPLTLSGAPTANLHAATKQYVDGYVTAVNGDIASLSTSKTDKTTTITAGTGLSGGGDLSTNRTLSIASSGVTATQLASNAVTTSKIADSAVTSAKIGAGQVTAAKLSGNQTGTAPIYGVRAFCSATRSGSTWTIVGAGISSIVTTSGYTDGTSIDVTIDASHRSGNNDYAVFATALQGTPTVQRMATVYSKTSSGFTIQFSDDSSLNPTDGVSIAIIY